MCGAKDRWICYFVLIGTFGVLTYLFGHPFASIPIALIATEMIRPGTAAPATRAVVGALTAVERVLSLLKDLTDSFREPSPGGNPHSDSDPESDEDSNPDAGFPSNATPP
jgi:hypothetical protein